jgi:adenylate kinase family enzyme
MKKVAILGSPGTGKTTFSIELAKKTNLPIIHLDFYHHQLKYNYYNDLEAWIARVESLIKQRKWIMDGNYNSTLIKRCDAADTIIFFDYSRMLSIYRVLKRRLQYRNKKRQDMPDDWKEKVTWGFLVYVWQYNDHSRKKILNELSLHQDKKVLIFTKPSQAKLFLDEF